MLRIDQLQEAISASTHSSASPATSKRVQNDKEDHEEDEYIGFARAWRELSQLWRNHRAQDAEIEALREEVEHQALPGEVDDLLKLFKRRAQLKRSAHRARWMSVALKSYRFIHVGFGQITFLALLVHILHALKVIKLPL